MSKLCLSLSFVRYICRPLEISFFALTTSGKYFLGFSFLWFILYSQFNFRCLVYILSMQSHRWHKVSWSLGSLYVLNKPNGNFKEKNQKSCCDGYQQENMCNYRSCKKEQKVWVQRLGIKDPQITHNHILLIFPGYFTASLVINLFSGLYKNVCAPIVYHKTKLSFSNDKPH